MKCNMSLSLLQITMLHPCPSALCDACRADGPCEPQHSCESIEVSRWPQVSIRLAFPIWEPNRAGNPTARVGAESYAHRSHAFDNRAQVNAVPRYSELLAHTLLPPE
jgi:hypothetical protein